MKTGIGIDTGGTYTDAAAYDFMTGAVLQSAKSLTTKGDLSIGIGRALDELAPALLQKADMVALSTTLATNACVENKGGRVGLILIGADSALLEKVGDFHGLPPAGEILFVPAEITINGEVVSPPDWDAFLAECGPWVKGKQALAVVQFGAKHSGAQLEKQCKALLARQYALPVVCGHELFTDLNMMRRAASALLNARLLPVIREFLSSVKQALKERGVTAPVVVVRSDGTLMSEQFAAMRPVETLLCGPAASVMYGAEVSGGETSLIIDMGGTTTDVAMIADNAPVRAKYGIEIGQWKTFVKGMFIHTFGLGGDSAVRYDRQYRLTLGPERLIPLCILSKQHPQIKDTLRALLANEKQHSQWLHEFFCLARQPGDLEYSAQELAFCEALENGPLSFAQAAALMDCDLYNFRMDRLEREGVVLRSGLTPTDIMHIKGDFDAYDAEASVLGARVVAQNTGMDEHALADNIYDMVKKKLYCELVEMMLSQRREFAEKRDDQLKANISLAWEAFLGRDTGFAAPRYGTQAVLVGLGAPIHVFLEDVARALHTRCAVPKDAPVANAVGALVGNVSCEYEVSIGFHTDESGLPAYIVHGTGGNIKTKTLEAAVSLAEEQAKQAAVEEARRRGAMGELKLSAHVKHQNALSADGLELYLGSSVVAQAIGRITV